MLDIDWTKKQLLILPFDHRGSFMKKLFGISGRPPTEEETRNISDYKTIIYDGFKQALEKGVPKDPPLARVKNVFSPRPTLAKIFR